MLENNKNINQCSSKESTILDSNIFIAWRQIYFASETYLNTIEMAFKNFLEATAQAGCLYISSVNEEEISRFPKAIKEEYKLWPKILDRVISGVNRTEIIRNRELYNRCLDRISNFFEIEKTNRKDVFRDNIAKSLGIKDAADKFLQVSKKPKCINNEIRTQHDTFSNLLASQLSDTYTKKMFLSGTAIEIIFFDVFMIFSFFDLYGKEHKDIRNIKNDALIVVEALSTNSHFITCDKKHT